MFKHVLWTASAVVLIAVSPSASAQYYVGGSGCSSCGSTPSYSAPMYSATSNCAPVSTISCTPIQPVYSTAYQTVPVVKYREEEQVVEEPYYKTSYVNQKVTKMVPVTVQRTVDVPFVSYKSVQQNRVVHRDMGRWVTNYQPVAKAKPCQVDCRPGMLGWLNRTGYSVRSAFTPNYRTSRQYVPKMMACNVATTRQVAVPGTRKVTYNQTKMVARESTERVAVRELAYRKKVVKVSKPVITAYKQVPIGSSLAYGSYGSSLAYGGGFGSGFVFADDDDTQTALRPHPDDGELATRAFEADDEPIRSGSLNNSKTKEPPYRGSSLEREVPPKRLPPPRAAEPAWPDDKAAPNFEGYNDSRRSSPRRTVPQRRVEDRPIVLSGWKASRRSTSQTASNSQRQDPDLVLNDR